jgi:hypothetical protein
LQLGIATITAPSKDDRRLLDQFAFRYTRLQDDMGNRLIPAILNALGENAVEMAALDRLNRMEQLGWLPDVEEWMSLRRLRNEFAHEYPEAPAARLERLQLAMAAARRLIALLAAFEQRLQERFAEVG